MLRRFALARSVQIQTVMVVLMMFMFMFMRMFLSIFTNMVIFLRILRVLFFLCFDGFFTKFGKEENGISIAIKLELSVYYKDSASSSSISIWMAVLRRISFMFDSKWPRFGSIPQDATRSWVSAITFCVLMVVLKMKNYFRLETILYCCWECHSHKVSEVWRIMGQKCFAIIP